MNRGRSETWRKIGEEKEVKKVKEKVTHLSDNDDDETGSSWFLSCCHNSQI